MKLTGQSLVAGRRTPGNGPPFSAVDPRTGAALEPEYRSAGMAEVDRAARSAREAFATFCDSSGETRARLLREAADRLEARADRFASLTPAETALPEARVRAELARTTGQLRLFSEVAAEGSWVDARIDHADPERKPVPKPDVRSLLRPTGPVAVFGAGNFPLAFSVAGGDTASALAAGCPVIVKAHPAHPGTSELAGEALAQAVEACGLPGGVFSLLFDAGHEVGRALVAHPDVTAVAFTGSRAGGLALVQCAASRDVPIPVFAEMSSVNPIFILPGALAARSVELADGLHASVTTGVGQLCTCPGLVILEPSEHAEKFLELLAARLAATAPGVMFSAGVQSAYDAGVSRMRAHRAVRCLTPQATGAALFRTTARELLGDLSAAAEVFGPSTLAVVCDDRAQMLALANALEGQLSATVLAEPFERAGSAELLRVLERKAGRLIINGFPTGVDVGHAMVHGGPYPATFDGRSTSVGTRAILRFVRAVCYQDVPDALLPLALREGNPLQIARRVDGRWQAG